MEFIAELKYGELAGILPILRISGLAVGLFVAVLYMVATAKIYAKAGKAPWKAIVPIYNIYVMYEIVYYNGLRSIRLFASILLLAASIVMKIDIVALLMMIFIWLEAIVLIYRLAKLYFRNKWTCVLTVLCYSVMVFVIALEGQYEWRNE